MYSSRLIRLTLIFTVLGLVIFSGFAAAKGNKYENKVAEHLAYLKTNLNLTDAQAAQVKTILDESQKAAMTDRQKYKGNKEGYKTASMERQKSMDEKIMAVLDDSQKTQFDKIKDTSWENMKTQKTQKTQESQKTPAAPKSGY